LVTLLPLLLIVLLLLLIVLLRAVDPPWHCHSAIVPIYAPDRPHQLFCLAALWTATMLAALLLADRTD
jgi:hypothetical protein